MSVCSVNGKSALNAENRFLRFSHLMLRVVCLNFVRRRLFPGGEVVQHHDALGGQAADVASRRSESSRKLVDPLAHIDGTGFDSRQRCLSDPAPSCSADVFVHRIWPLKRWRFNANDRF